MSASEGESISVSPVRSGRRRPDYQVEPTELADAAFARGYLTPLELFRIGAWKSARGLAWMSLNSEDEIRDRTHHAISSVGKLSRLNVLQDNVDWDEWQTSVALAICEPEGLIGLKGVAFPMASAVLAILLPAACPVIDRWTVQAVFGLPSSSTRWKTCAAYRQFTELLVQHSGFYPSCSSVHQVDQAVMNGVIAGGTLPFRPVALESR